MDTIKQTMELARKYKYVLLVVIIGLTLMLLPEPQDAELPEHTPETEMQTTMQEALAEILNEIQGVGKVRVLLTEARGIQTLYVYDQSSSADSSRADAVIITDSSRDQTGLVSQVIPPVYQGAIVVCQGGDNPAVRLAVSEAVCDATGLTADKITILKMK